MLSTAPQTSTHLDPAERQRLQCSFCGRTADQTRFLCAGVFGGMICDRCCFTAAGLFAKADALRDAQHQPAIKKDAVFFIGVADDFALQRFERDEVEFRSALPGRQLLDKFPRGVN